MRKLPIYNKYYITLYNITNRKGKKSIICVVFYQKNMNKTIESSFLFN